MANESTAPANPSQITQTAIDTAISSASAVLTARLNGIEKAQELFQADLTRVPTTVDRQIVALRDVLEAKLNEVDGRLAGTKGMVEKEIWHVRNMINDKVSELGSVTSERFLGVASQFNERDTRTDQRAGDTKLAVDAAFAAAKEATAKIEAGFTKQIDAMINIIDTKTSNLAGGLSDIKDRMTALENRTAGINSAKTDNRNQDVDSRALVFGVMGIVIGVMAIIIHFIR
jgi:hypothetical protein